MFRAQQPMTLRSGQACGFACAALLVASGAHAAIVSTSGGVSFMPTPPASCTPGALATFGMRAWNEQTNVIGPLAVDLSLNPSSSNLPTTGVLAGPVNSHFLHWETIQGIAMLGTVIFDQPIVGVAYSDALLDLSDAPAGSPSTTYPTLLPTRGMLLGPGGSVVTINPTLTNPNRLDVSIITANGGPNPNIDFMQIRVFTAVPAPGSGALAGAMAILARRRRRA